jgi:CoA-dependent NAD(P)H sulfur oxidoreductase
MTPEEVEQRGIVVRTGWEATSIEKQEKFVVVENRETNTQERAAFDILAITTGAIPIRPSIPGIDFQNVFALRTLADGIALKAQVDRWMIDQEKRAAGKGEPFNVVIVGGGYIGMELCEAFAKRGAVVTILEKADRILGSMDTPVTQIVEETIAREKIRLLKETTALGFEGSMGMAHKVVTDKGEFNANLVVLAIGVSPASALAVSAGIATGIRRTITVDSHMRTSAPDIYAAGDCADATFIVTGKKTYIPLGTTANKQGRIAGENIAGRETTFDGVAGTAQTKIFDLEVARTGLSSLEAEQESLDFFTSTIKGRSRAKAYPAGKPILVTYTVERGSGRLLGAQMVGQEGVAHRIDTLAACLYGRMTVEDVARLDLGYAPPFATVWDPMLVAANAALKEMGTR